MGLVGSCFTAVARVLASFFWSGGVRGVLFFLCKGLHKILFVATILSGWEPSICLRIFWISPSWFSRESIATGNMSSFFQAKTQEGKERLLAAGFFRLRESSEKAGGSWRRARTSSGSSRKRPLDLELGRHKLRLQTPEDG